MRPVGISLNRVGTRKYAFCLAVCGNCAGKADVVGKRASVFVDTATDVVGGKAAVCNQRDARRVGACRVAFDRVLDEGSEACRFTIQTHSRARVRKVHKACRTCVCCRAERMVVPTVGQSFAAALFHKLFEVAVCACKVFRAVGYVGSTLVNCHVVDVDVTAVCAVKTEFQHACARFCHVQFRNNVSETPLVCLAHNCRQGFLAACKCLGNRGEVRRNVEVVGVVVLGDTGVKLYAVLSCRGKYVGVKPERAPLLAAVACGDTDKLVALFALTFLVDLRRRVTRLSKVVCAVCGKSSPQFKRTFFGESGKRATAEYDCQSQNNAKHSH